MNNKQKTSKKFRSYIEFKEHQAYLKDKRINELNTLKTELINPTKILLLSSKAASTLIKKRKEKKNRKQISSQLKVEPKIQKIKTRKPLSRILHFLKKILTKNHWIQWQLIYFVGKIALRFFVKARTKK